VAKKGDVIWFFVQYSCQMAMVGCELKVLYVKKPSS
jgi:hypothetical protein